jgi:predicted PurR-regulated permease PerM
VPGQRSRTNLYFFAFLLFAILTFNVAMVAPYLLAVGMGGILAILTRAPYRRLQSRGLGPKTSALVVVVTSSLVILVPLGFFLLRAAAQAVDLGRFLLEHGDEYYRSGLDFLHRHELVHRFIPDLQAYEPRLRASLEQGIKSGVGVFAGFLGQMPEMGLQIALALMAMFFFLVDGEALARWARGKIPMDPDVRRSVVDTVKNTTISTIWATITAAGVQAVLVFLGFTVLGVPQGALAAGATFVFAWIPILGSAPVVVAGATDLYLQGSILKLVLMVVLGVVTGVADNVTRPWVLRGRGDLHPLVALVAIFGGIHGFGLWGGFIGPIAAAVLLSMLEVWPRVGRYFGLLPLHEGITMEPTAEPPPPRTASGIVDKDGMPWSSQTSEEPPRAPA